MDFKALKWKMLRGGLAKRLVLGVFCFVLAMATVSFTHITNEVRTNEQILLNLDKCSLSIDSITHSQLEVPGVYSLSAQNLTFGVIREMINNEMLSLDARALCVGEGSDSNLLTLRELGFSNAFAAHKNPFLSLIPKRFEREVEFKANSFDFVFSRTLDSVPISAPLLLEIERVLRPGGTGMMLVASYTNMGSLVRFVTPISLLLRSSEIVNVCGIGSFVLIMFKKRLDSVVGFGGFRLPNECPSISRNKPFMQHIEPLVDQKSVQFEKKASYLPNFMNVSSRNRFIYINMGAGELGPNYPIHPQAFNVYLVDHNVSALSSYVKNPGVTFVYYPGLVEDTNIALGLNHGDDYAEAPLHEELFEFVKWFKETTKDGDYVVLTMNAGVTQVKVLFALFESGAICHVDELFLRCSEGVDCKTSCCGDCTSLFNGLRNAGVFVHQWFGA